MTQPGIQGKIGFCMHVQNLLDVTHEVRGDNVDGRSRGYGNGHTVKESMMMMMLTLTMIDDC